MAINFPSAPILGQTVPVGNKVYAWNGTAWEIPTSPAGGGGGGGASVTTDDNPPAIPKDGDMWLKTTTGVLYVYYDDGNSKQWVQVSASPQMPILPYDGPDFISGLTMVNNITTPNTILDILLALGKARGNNITVTSAATMSKKLDVAWAAGNNAGGLDTGAKAASKTYFVWAIRKQSDLSFDWLYSLSLTAPTVPAASGATTQ